MKSMKGEKILLLGLGRANRAVARYLFERGAEMYLFEERIEKLPPDLNQLIKDAGIRPYEKRRYDLVITSPGFPIDRPVVGEVLKEGNTIVDEIEFTFGQLNRPVVIAVTGTNGKSTTVALISSIMNAQGLDHFVGGNISPGRPFSEALFLPPCDSYLLEISSFQLMRISRFKPHIGVITNITLDHLNWHRDINEYREAKLRIFMNQDKHDYAVLSAADHELKGVIAHLRSRTVLFGFDAYDGSWLNGNFHYGGQKLFSKDSIKIVGRHNHLNIMAAIAVAKILELDDRSIEYGVKNFTTLPHRLEEVATRNGIRFINNSMCTNETAAIESFKAYDRPKIVIVGGKEKGDAGINYLELLTREAKMCVILGANATFIEGIFKRNGFVDYQIAKDMENAVSIARRAAAPGDIVMLNPGYASFDIFANFEDRGEAFRRAVNEG